MSCEISRKNSRLLWINKEFCPSFRHLINISLKNLEFKPLGRIYHSSAEFCLVYFVFYAFHSFTYIFMFFFFCIFPYTQIRSQNWPVTYPRLYLRPSVASCPFQTTTVNRFETNLEGFSKSWNFTIHFYPKIPLLR